MRTRIRRSTPRSCCSSASARSAHRSCFARSGQAWHGCAGGALLQPGRPRAPPSGPRGGLDAFGGLTWSETSVAATSRRYRALRTAPRSWQRDPREHDRRLLEVLRGEPEEASGPARARSASRRGRTRPRRARAASPAGRGSPRPAAASSTASRTSSARAASRPRRSSSRSRRALWPASPSTRRSRRGGTPCSCGTPRARRGPAGGSARAPRPLGRPGTARTTSSTGRWACSRV